MSANPTVPKRDNLLGVCAAIGEDFGFDPFFLRVALAIGVIAAPKVALIAYASAALLVLVSRLATRERRGTTPSADVRTLVPAPPRTAGAIEMEAFAQAA